MSKLHNRLQQLEKRRNEQPNTPQVIEIYGTRADGTQYLMDRWVNPNITEAMHARSMDTLAAVLSDETGEPMTGADAEKALQELKQ